MADTSEITDDTPALEDDTAAEHGGIASLNLRPELTSALERLGFVEPTPIQREAIPVLLSGADVVGQAATGTGKTAAFALPVLEQLSNNREAFAAAIVLAPTRELASQVAEAFRSYGAQFKVRVAELIGGQPIGPQMRDLRNNPQVIVATPGRAIDHLKRGTLNLDGVNTFILDEADEMLDMGFAEDIELLLDHSPKTRQTVLFSATMPPRIDALIKKHLTDPQRISIKAAPQDQDDAPLIEQRLYVVKKMHKAGAIARVLDFEQPGSAIIFCRTRTDVDELTVALNQRNYRAEALHGGMDQPQRERVMGRLRDGTAQLLVATDVAARGLDVSTLTHVINHDVPTAPESYLHRIGRVGRAGRKGTALTFAMPRQDRLVGNIERLVGRDIPVHRVPKAKDVAEQRQNRLIDEIREALQADDLDDLQPILHELKGETNDRAIALAALHLLRQSKATVDDTNDIPDASATYEREAGGRHKGKGKGKGQRQRNGSKHDRGDRGNNKRGDRPHREPDPNTGYIYVGVGSRGGVRPGDLVGAIANESGLSGRDVGPIRIHDHHSVVGVPDASVEDVIKAINKSTVKGKKTKARRYVDDKRHRR